MTVTLVMAAALVVAGGWIIYQQLRVNKQLKELEEQDEHIERLEYVLFNVARGELDVGIANGEVRASRKITGGIQRH